MILADITALLCRKTSTTYDSISEEWLGRDGKILKLLDSFPVLGYLVAVIDAVCGDRDRALRAIAECTSSAIVTAFGALGELFGGTLGATLAVGPATPVALFVRSRIAGYIRDSTIRSGINDAFTSQEVVAGMTKYVLSKVARRVL